MGDQRILRETQIKMWMGSKEHYDRGVNTFSPEGRIYQIEYAIKAIKFGSTAIGVKTNQGVILGVEKKLQSSKLQVSSGHSEKLVEIDRHCACAMSGIVGDARILIDHARVEAQNHTFNYNEPMDVEAITQAVSDLAINFGEGYEDSKKRKPMARPYGVALLIGGVDENGPQLYQTDPSGTYTQWQADAIGSGHETSMTYLKEQYHQNLSIEEAQKMIMQSLKNVMEEGISKDNVEMVVIKSETRKIEKITPDAIGAIIATLT